MQQLNLDTLSKEKITGLSPTFGAFLAEAAMVCLRLNEHKSGIILNVDGDFETQLQLVWTAKLTQNVIDSWKDLNEATEYAATAIAILLVHYLMNIGRITRNIGAADYILSDVEINKNKKEDLLYLEISGIFIASKNNTISQRVNKKIIQVTTGIGFVPFVVVVVEFGTPKAKIIYKQ